MEFVKDVSSTFKFGIGTPEMPDNFMKSEEFFVYLHLNRKYCNKQMIFSSCI